MNENETIEITQKEYKDLLKSGCKIEILKDYLAENDFPDKKVMLSIIGEKMEVKKDGRK